MIKKYFFTLLAILLGTALFSTHAFASVDLHSVMQVTQVEGAGGETTDLQNNIFKKIQDLLFAISTVVVIGMLIYSGFRLFSAQGDPAEYKKAWTSVIYIAVGLAVLPLAYVLVKIVTGI